MALQDGVVLKIDKRMLIAYTGHKMVPLARQSTMGYSEQYRVEFELIQHDIPVKPLQLLRCEARRFGLQCSLRYSIYLTVSSHEYVRDVVRLVVFSPPNLVMAKYFKTKAKHNLSHHKPDQAVTKDAESAVHRDTRENVCPTSFISNHWITTI